MRMPEFSVDIIEASAGTGKTHRITEEFFNLIDRENPAESLQKMMAITFSEKAAVEMKSRILSKVYTAILADAQPYEKVLVENALFRLKISTIHSFCRRVLKRFSFFIGIDPFFSVMDGAESSLLFLNSIGQFIRTAEGRRASSDILRDIKLRRLSELLVSMNNSHPYVFSGSPAKPFTRKIADIYDRVSGIHFMAKKELSSFDFDDLEKMTFEMVSDNEHAFLVLEDFDEKINNIFLDEFQDTNLLQWSIINKLLEEWLSGFGAKAESGQRYGVFIVGDRKQSIYKFRGAESGIFDDAKKALEGYYRVENLSHNYRSADTIIDFVNRVFEDIPPWSEQRLVSGIDRSLPSLVEINIEDANSGDSGGGESSLEDRYAWVIGKIRELVECGHMVWDREAQALRPASYRDIAILMRKRSGDKFRILEDMLKSSGLPFVILGGMGFYRETEIIFLLSLVFALSDSSDQLAMWNLANSVCGISSADIRRWRGLLAGDPLSSVIEIILKEKKFWEGLNSQQKANVEKFLIITEEMDHLPLYQAAKTLRERSLRHEEPKADIFSAKQDAVKVLTVHSSKGLEFPAVFLVNLEDGSYKPADSLLYLREPRDGGRPYRYCLSAEADKDFKEEFGQMMGEEEMRLLYVALTRASQYLYLSGVKKKRSGCWVDSVEKLKDEYPSTPAAATSIPLESSMKEKGEDEQTLFYPSELTCLTSFSGQKEKRFYRREGVVAGKILHLLLNELSKGRIQFEKEEFMERAGYYLVKSGWAHLPGCMEFIEKSFMAVNSSRDLMDIVMCGRPGAECFSELPFLFRQGSAVYEGVIDRVIAEEGLCRIYDYKSYGAPGESYREQLDLYEAAVKRMFSPSSVERFVVIFPQGDIIKV